MKTEIKNHTYGTHDGLTDRYGNTLETIGDCVEEMNDLMAELIETRRRYAEACASADRLCSVARASGREIAKAHGLLKEALVCGVDGELRARIVNLIG